MAQDVALALRKARGLIEDKSKWFGGDEPRRPANPTAFGFQRCASHALLAVMPPMPAWSALRRAMGLTGLNGTGVPEWNDSHSHAEVIAAFDRAIDAEMRP